MTASLRSAYDRRLQSLKSARAPFEADWKDISAYVDPRKARFFDRQRGFERDARILNATARLALRTTQAGLSAGISSPSRPWFRLATPDPDMMEWGPVREWLHRVNLTLLDVCAKSNAYHVLPRIYSDEAAFGQGVMLVDGDFDDVLVCQTYPVGEYYLGAGKNGRVDTLYRETALTVGQMIGRFGPGKVSDSVRRLYDKSDTETLIPVIHVVEPNDDRIEGRAGVSGKAWRSAWFEADTRATMLEVSGYEECPIMAPRWEVIGHDSYGVGPGHDALGDAIALQRMELTKHRLIQTMLKPQTVAPTTLKGSLQGDTIFADDGKGTRVLHEVNPQGLLAIRQEIEAAERRIDSTFFRDVFMMIANSASPQRTAMEVMELREEKMVNLGPMLTRQFYELLDPFIDRVYALASRARLLPPPPDELRGQTLGVEYISMLAVAQKAAEVQGIRDLGAFVGAMMSIDPSVSLKFAADQAIDDFARLRAINPRLVVPDDKVAEKRAAIAQQQQQADQAAMARTAIEGAQTLAATPLEGDTALSAILGR